MLAVSSRASISILRITITRTRFSKRLNGRSSTDKVWEKIYGYEVLCNLFWLLSSSRFLNLISSIANVQSRKGFGSYGYTPIRFYLLVFSAFEMNNCKAGSWF